MEIKIRKAEARDRDAIIRLLVQIAAFHRGGRPDLFKPGGKKYDGAALEKILADEKNHRVFVAEGGDGRVAGYCICEIFRYKDHSVYNDHSALYIDDFCVDENIRGQGIGQKLFAAAYGFAKEIGAHDIELNVSEFNENAIRFYERCGFKVKSRRMEIVM